MKKIITFIVFLFALLNVNFAQKGKTTNESYISISTSFNYYPKIPPYNFFISYSNNTNDELILNFITANSGTFVLEEGEIIRVERDKISEFPSQIIGFGAGVRIQKESNLVHEISITKLTINRSSYFVKFLFLKDDEIRNQVFQGYEQKSGAFACRYEIGKIFGKKRSKIKFGLTGGLEPTFYYFNRISYTLNDFPIAAKLFTIDFSLIPTLTFNVGKKSFLDFKTVSNLLVADFSSKPSENIPFVQSSNGETDIKGISWAFVLQFRYNIKEPKKKRRRN